jgi:uncharacterized membrane protein
MFFTVIFEIGGNFLPMLFGDKDLFSLWSILCGIIFGIIGVFVGVFVARRIG